MPDRVLDTAVNDRGHYIGFLPFLLAEPPGAHERHLDPAGGVGAGDGACPDPRDDIGFAAIVELRLRVEVSDPALRLVTHPGAVAAHVLGEPGRLRPARALTGGVGEDGRAIRELRRNLDERFVDEHGDGVEIGGVRFEPETLGLERNGATAGEGIENSGRVASGRAVDLLAHLFEQTLIAEVVPVHHPSDEIEQALPFGFDALVDETVDVALATLLRLVAELVLARRGIVHELREEHRTSRRQGRRAHQR
ncbi:hypothetical protein [Leucobacter soli]